MSYIIMLKSESYISLPQTGLARQDKNLQEGGAYNLSSSLKSL